jgi:hypothetical protein
MPSSTIARGRRSPSACRKTVAPAGWMGSSGAMYANNPRSTGLVMPPSMSTWRQACCAIHDLPDSDSPTSA